MIKLIFALILLTPLYGVLASAKVLSTVSPVTLSSAKLILGCGPNGLSYQPFFYEGGFFVGTNGFGFSQIDSCNQAVAAARTTVCSVGQFLTGTTYYQPYFFRRNIPIGNINNGFTDLNDCIIATKNSRLAVCYSNGSSYQPYSVVTGTAIGLYAQGFSDLSDCARATSKSTKSVCNWDGSGYTTYDIRSNAEISSFATLDDCLNASAAQK